MLDSVSSKIVKNSFGRSVRYFYNEARKSLINFRHMEKFVVVPFFVEVLSEGEVMRLRSPFYFKLELYKI